MITYLIYSALSLAILLLFYHAVLIKEKMHHINRGYLLFSIIFSLSIPLVPVGIMGPLLPFEQPVPSVSDELSESVIYSDAYNTATGYEGEMIAPAAKPGLASMDLFIPILITIYFAVALILFVRLLRIIHMIQMKSSRNPRTLYKDCEVVLLPQNVVPHTFLNTLFVNKKQFEKGNIRREILLHELAHAKQKHSIDILFIELLKIFFWFNPMLYLYKRAIHLNHEFLADEAVLKTGIQVSDYQQTLLKTLLHKPSHTLASSLNFGLTRKRLQMMTQSTNKTRSIMKIASLIPLFLALSLLLGCESTPADAENADDESTTNIAVDEQSLDPSLIKISINSKSEIIVDGETLTLDELHTLLDERGSDSSRVISLRVSRDAEFGTILDVQNILRTQGSRRINYSVNTETNETEGNVYSGQTLTLPPPPTPPSQESKSRISTESSQIKTTPAPPVPPNANNLLTILINAQGMMLVNEEPETVTEIKGRVKEFVNNHGANPALSSSPGEAILAIKRDTRLDYERYIEILDEIMTAYNELREEAARERFGVPFSSIDENSERYREIREAYPKRISIAETDN